MRFLGSLKGNNIGVEGAKAIGGALAVNQSLIELKYAAPLHALAFTVSSLSTPLWLRMAFTHATPIRYVDHAHIPMSDSWVVRTASHPEHVRAFTETCVTTVHLSQRHIQPAGRLRQEEAARSGG